LKQHEKSYQAVIEAHKKRLLTALDSLEADADAGRKASDIAMRAARQLGYMTMELEHELVELGAKRAN
jgi:hypothetical protein